MAKSGLMEMCEKGWRYVFLACCTVVTFYSIYELLLTYTKNEDSSKIHYKKFGEFKGETIYPMISICIVTFGGKSLIRKNIFSEPEEEVRYNSALTGDVEYMHQNVSQHIDFDEININLKYYMDSFEIENLNHDRLERWDHSNNQTASFPFYKSYQDPKTMCFSYNNHEHTMSTVNIIFDNQKLAEISSSDHEYYFYIYLTNDHQLIRNMLYLQKEDLWYLPKKSVNHVRIDVTGISLLRLRPSAKDRCNSELENDDFEWMKKVVAKVGCIPSYWKFLKLDNNVPCNHTYQYKNFTNFFARVKRNNVNDVFDEYSPPCTRMRILTSIKFLDYYKKNKTRIDFRYLTREFEEIRNVRDFDLETMIGNIGGYVGMIMGISILQISYFLVTSCTKFIRSLKIND